jgi:DNA-binding response OmpR family regulator
MTYHEGNLANTSEAAVSSLRLLSMTQEDMFATPELQLVAQTDATQPENYTFYGGHAVIEPRPGLFTFREVPVRLTPKAHDLLTYLGSAPGVALSFGTIMDAVWPKNDGYHGEYRTLMQHVSMIRRVTNRGIIVNELSFGYFAPK